jgi:hypothetical protein
MEELLITLKANLLFTSESQSHNYNVDKRLPVVNKSLNENFPLLKSTYQTYIIINMIKYPIGVHTSGMPINILYEIMQ